MAPGTGFTMSRKLLALTISLAFLQTGFVTAQNNCDFDSNFCGWQQIQLDDQFDWDRENGETPTSDTGPYFDHTTGKGQYIYAEASGRIKGEQARMISEDVYVNSGTYKCFRFWYFIYGSSIGAFRIYTSATGAFNDLGSPRYEIKTTQGNQWIMGQIDLKSSADGSAFKIVLESEIGSGEAGDIAIDDVSLFSGACPQVVVTPSPGSMPSVLQCDFEDQDICNFVQDTQDELDWARQSGRTGSPDTGPPVDHTYGTDAVQPPEADASPGPTSARTTLPPPTTQWDCDFEKDICNYLQPNDDIFDWSRDAGDTSSGGTGPSKDHTLGTNKGFYVYIEASTPRVTGDIARFESSNVPYTFRKMCIDFWYHMYGDHIGTLNVYLKIGGLLGTPVWKSVGTSSDVWYRGQILHLPNDDFQVSYEGIIGGSYPGHIALDDLSIYYGNCKGIDHSEAFWCRPFPVNGQGTLIFNTDRKGHPFAVSVEDRAGVYWMDLHVEKDYAAFRRQGKDDVAPGELTRVTGEEYGVEDGKQSYWYSYDRDNLVLKYGKGYRMEETTLMEFDFLAGVEGEGDQEKVREEMYPYFNAEGKKLVKLYDAYDVKARDIRVTEPKVEFDKLPFVCNIPPLVLDSSKATLFTLDRGYFVNSASLPPTCRELYESIKGCELDYSENVGEEKVLLSDAIRYSIQNGILGEKLIEKEGELSENKNGTYLRVTLGSSLGKSPGVPYVLEIWPAGHFSPVHNHGNANAIIKVLYGSLTVNVYNKLTGKGTPEPLSTLEIRKDDVLWLNRNWYQTHKLYNKGTEYCATIQCYKYSAMDLTYWPYFDFVADDETIDEFFPGSDFGFIEMRTQVMAEYTDYVRGIKKL